MNTLDTSTAQLSAVNAFFDAQKAYSDRLIYVADDVSAPPSSSSPNRLAA
jgi:tRNA-dihydrouridine synthase B